MSCAGSGIGFNVGDFKFDLRNGRFGLRFEIVFEARSQEAVDLIEGGRVGHMNGEQALVQRHDGGALMKLLGQRFLPEFSKGTQLFEGAGVFLGDVFVEERKGEVRPFAVTPGAQVFEVLSLFLQVVHVGHCRARRWGSLVGRGMWWCVGWWYVGGGVGMLL